MKEVEMAPVNINGPSIDKQPTQVELMDEAEALEGGEGEPMAQTKNPKRLVS
jgi:hypothetical protein